MTRPATSPEQVQARIDGYRGRKGTSESVRDFVRETVRDSVRVAPQPVTEAWIAYSTSCVGLLAKSCEAKGTALDREVVFERGTIDRFITVDCKGMSDQGRSGYRSRLDVVASALLAGQDESSWPRAVLFSNDVVAPWDTDQSARVAHWARNLRPRSRRERLSAVLALAEGAGLRRRDLVVVTGSHVRSDEHGVHIDVPGVGDEKARTVTVAARWEVDVRALAQRAGKNLLLAPDRATLDPNTISAAITQANATAARGDEFMLRRARNTWLARHLVAGTPLPLLMQQAGLTTTAHLEDLLQFLPAPTTDPEKVAAWMRLS